MNSMILHTVLMCGFAILQTLVFPAGIIRGAVPDVALILLCFSANYHGSYRGELGGFVSGIVVDSLSLAPFGFHALIRTTIGFLYGLSRGKLFIDPILVPVIMIVVATALQGVFAFILASIFSPNVAASVFSASFGIEMVLNALLAPFIFALLRSTGMVVPGREQKGYE